MTQEIIDIVEQRRKSKNKYTRKEYKNLLPNSQKNTQRSKEKEVSESCKEIEIIISKMCMMIIIYIKNWKNTPAHVKEKPITSRLRGHSLGITMKKYCWQRKIIVRNGSNTLFDDINHEKPERLITANDEKRPKCFQIWSSESRTSDRNTKIFRIWWNSCWTGTIFVDEIISVSTVFSTKSTKLVNQLLDACQK